MQRGRGGQLSALWAAGLDPRATGGWMPGATTRNRRLEEEAERLDLARGERRVQSAGAGECLGRSTGTTKPVGFGARRRRGARGRQGEVE